MRRILAVVLLLVSLPLLAGEIVIETVASKVLGRDYKVALYLPDGYKDSNQRYPMLLLLHGASGNERDWVDKGSVLLTMDALVKRRLIHPMVVVMPGDGSNWWVDGASARSETALMTEVLPAIEARYRVAAERSNRLIGGLSMGGYGALNLSLKYPERFAAAAIMSPAIYDPLPPETSASRRTPQFVRDGKFDPELWKSLNYPAHLERYMKSGTVVPMWIISGDHDFLGIAVMSANLYWRLYQYQKNAVELRIVDGDHEWMVWRDGLGDALQYMNRYIKGPQ